jgi:hypothetical protein
MLCVVLALPPVALAFSIYGLWKNASKWKIYLSFLVISLSLIAYSYEPIGSPDLERYFEMVEACSNMTLEGALEYFSDAMIVKTIVFWMIGRLGMPHLLPALSVGIVYGVAGYITCDTAVRFRAERYIGIVILFQIMMLPFISTTNNVRNICAYSLILLAAYKDLVKRQRTVGVALLYILPCFIHATGIVLLALRLVYIILKKQKWLALVSVFLIPTAIEVAYQNRSMIRFTGNIGTMLQTVIIKAYWYMNDETSEWAVMVSARPSEHINRFFLMAVAAVMCLLIISMGKKKNDVFRENRNFTSYLFLRCLLVLASNIFTVPHYWRFSAATMVASGGLLIPLLKDTEQQTVRQPETYVLHGLLACMLFGVFIQTWSSRYIVDYADLFAASCINNIFVVGIQLIYRILRM